MEIPVYLAMTATEFRACSSMPANPAWLSCLFSPYGRGLSNIPKQLPPDSLLVLSDRTPPYGHDPNLIYQMLDEVIAQLGCIGLLLDFEQPDNPETMEIASVLADLPCPVAVAAPYAADLDCPVFVPSPSPLDSLEAYIAPWKGRELWLEVSTQTQKITVSESGATVNAYNASVPMPYKDSGLCCHYSVNVSETAATFTLQRNKEDWEKLLANGKDLGITKAVGLYQELG